MKTALASLRSILARSYIHMLRELAEVPVKRLFAKPDCW